MSKSNERLSVHLRVYRGKAMTYNATGESTNENHIVKLEYNTAEYKRFLSMLRANGFIKADVEKVLDLTTKDQNGNYDEVSDFEAIQKEVDSALNPDGIEKELTADQKRIAALEAKIEALTNGKDVKDIKVKDSKEVKADSKAEKIELTEEDKAALNDARKKYSELYGKKGHPGWDLAEVNKRIAEFKPE